MQESVLVTLENVDLTRLRRLANDFVCEPISLPICFAVVGTLGAGKTRWTQELAGSLGIDSAEVTSPTFTLLRSYTHVPIGLHHVDAYRVGDEDEWWDLGLEECYQDPDAWTVVEWADRFADAMPTDAVWMWIDMENASPESCTRRIRFQCNDPHRSRWLEKVIERFHASTLEG